jgi:hypothetical protein
MLGFRMDGRTVDGTNYQMPLLNLVKKGFMVFAYDPMGQGMFCIAPTW